MEILKNLVKGTSIGAAVGLLLTFILPPFAQAIGIPHAIGELGNPVWMAGFVGAITGTTSLVQPVMNWLFGDGEKEAGEEKGKTPVARLHLPPALAKEMALACALPGAPSPLCENVSVSPNCCAGKSRSRQEGRL